jgi:hypothetical protein
VEAAFAGAAVAPVAAGKGGGGDGTGPTCPGLSAMLFAFVDCPEAPEAVASGGLGAGATARTAGDATPNGVACAETELAAASDVAVAAVAPPCAEPAQPASARTDAATRARFRIIEGANDAIQAGRLGAFAGNVP